MESQRSRSMSNFGKLKGGKGKAVKLSGTTTQITSTSAAAPTRFTFRLLLETVRVLKGGGSLLFHRGQMLHCLAMPPTHPERAHRHQGLCLLYGESLHYYNRFNTDKRSCPWRSVRSNQQTLDLDRRRGGKRLGMAASSPRLISALCSRGSTSPIQGKLSVPGQCLTMFRLKGIKFV